MLVHEMTLRILYAHADKAGVVYYANYFQFFEAGRTEYFRALGRSYGDFEREGALPTVVEGPTVDCPSPTQGSVLPADLATGKNKG